MPSIAFSTLACPGWPIPKVIALARTCGFDGIEWRGGDAGQVNPSSSHAQLVELVGSMRSAGLASIALTAYTTFVSPRREDRQANIELLRRYLDLAAEIGAPYVRVFLGELDPHEGTPPYEYIVESIQEAFAHARAAGVGIAIENDDDFAQTHAVEPVLTALPDPYLGVVWDIANGYSGGEGPNEALPNLHERIFYVQVKDGTGQHEQWRLTHIGEGQVPLQDAFKLLHRAGYSGAFSIEWEYAWHPELDPPEIALPRARETVSRMLDGIYSSRPMAPTPTRGESKQS